MSLPRRQRLLQRARGFTLLELLLVVVIAGLTLGTVALSFVGNRADKRSLDEEAQRIALLLPLARDEAIVRGQATAFEVDAQGYRFLVREAKGWQPLPEDGLLRQRVFKYAPIALHLSSAQNLAGVTSNADKRGQKITFGREAVDNPFALTLSLADATTVIRGDGIGHFWVE